MRTALWNTVLLLAVLWPLQPGALAYGGEEFTGKLHAASPTWDRIRDSGSTVGNKCDGSAPDSYNDAVPYAVFRIRTVIQESLSLEVRSESTSTLFDPFVAVYCRPFDPRHPEANLVAADDDGAGYPNAGFHEGESIYLTPGLVYDLVVSGYSLHEPYGQYRVILYGGAQRVSCGDFLPGIILLIRE